MRNVVFSVGRCNPPTLGHWWLIEQMRIAANELGCRAEFHIVDGETTGQDKRKNPLTSEQRLAILRKWFPSVRFEIVQSAYDAMEVLEVQNKIPLRWFAGSDRAKKYQRLLDYMGWVDGRIVVLDREDGPAKGISSTAAREAVLVGDFESFSRMMPSNVSEIHEIFDLVRKALNGDGSEQQRLPSRSTE